MAHSPITYKGQVYDLGFLAPSTIKGLSVEKLGYPIDIDIVYSNHCYSESYSPEIHDENDESPIIFDNSKKRVFCPIRFHEARRLPQLIHSTINSSDYLRRCNQGSNWTFFIKIGPPEQPYHVFMHFKKTGKKQMLCRVESAYPETTHPPRTKSRMRVPLILAKTYLGQKV